MVEERNRYAVKDAKNITAAITVTTSKFGPSGSLKSVKSIFEQTRAVTPKINNEIFFDLKYILVIISENLGAEISLSAVEILDRDLEAYSFSTPFG